MNVSRTQVFKLGIWICMLAIGIPVSYRTEGEWFSSTESMDPLSFIDEMCLADEVEISLRSHQREIRSQIFEEAMANMQIIRTPHPYRGGKIVRFRKPPAYFTDHSNG